jgi:hypothetical protein
MDGPQELNSPSSKQTGWRMALRVVFHDGFRAVLAAGVFFSVDFCSWSLPLVDIRGSMLGAGACAEGRNALPSRPAPPSRPANRPRPGVSRRGFSAGRRAAGWPWS